MGGCFASKAVIEVKVPVVPNNLEHFHPLYELKQNLLKKMNMTDDHFFKVMLTFRFKNTLRLTDELKYNIK